MYIIDSGFKKKESNLFHARKLDPYQDDCDPLPNKEDVNLNTGAKLRHSDADDRQF